ncbi:CPBP family intramembrane metalloprotease [Phycicoccus sp. CSK15P-2]|uniref:CPBP family intramembrane glutamic endopeptidase n=1 Tax=Phycicoccus sp. CSK15P-2 TaxID=2807627 RepID=UPI001952988F|nr:CPBP family intramembrane glutamic endopeptidase [Phycicoccus sp. CSK15P-2]MBM6405711.1 CPBP family intramembrane metalloprotease [Phycicoccus sp. CSK15P-2]
MALVTGVVLAAAAASAAVALAGASGTSWASDRDRLAPVVIAVVYGAVVVALLAVLGRTAQQRERWLGLRRTSPRRLTAGLCIWAGAYVVAAPCYLLLTPLGTSPADAVRLLGSVGADNGRLGTASAGAAAVILVRVLVLSPVAEELLFRGALYAWLRRRLPARWTILVTGVGFGLMHGTATFLPLAVLVGLAAGAIRERTASTWVPMAAHAAQNIVVVLTSLVLTGWHTPALLG